MGGNEVLGSVCVCMWVWLPLPCSSPAALSPPVVQLIMRWPTAAWCIAVLLVLAKVLFCSVCLFCTMPYYTVFGSMHYLTRQFSVQKWWINVFSCENKSVVVVITVTVVSVVSVWLRNTSLTPFLSSGSSSQQEMKKFHTLLVPATGSTPTVKTILLAICTYEIKTHTEKCILMGDSFA